MGGGAGRGLFVKPFGGSFNTSWEVTQAFFPGEGPQHARLSDFVQVHKLDGYPLAEDAHTPHGYGFLRRVECSSEQNSSFREVV